MAFKKGTSGNPGGGTNRKIWRDAILAAMRERTDKSFEEAVKDVARNLVDAACDKDVSALKEIGDRIDGKSLQSIEVTKKNPLDEFTAAELREMLDTIRRAEISNTGEAGASEAPGVPPLH